MKKKLIVFLMIVLSLMPLTTNFVYAQCADDAKDPLGLTCGADSGLTTTDPRWVVANIIKIALGFLGVIALVLIVYAGFKWMTAGGNEENSKSAMKIIFSAVIGLAIILGAYAITDFVFSGLDAAIEAPTTIVE